MLGTDWNALLFASHSAWEYKVGQTNLQSSTKWHKAICFYLEVEREVRRKRVRGKLGIEVKVEAPTTELVEPLFFKNPEKCTFINRLLSRDHSGAPSLTISSLPEAFSVSWPHHGLNS